MSEMMRSILCRVLSQEVAHQEIWKKEDIEVFGTDRQKRGEIVEEIKEWMKQNDVDFNLEYYYNEF